MVRIVNDDAEEVSVAKGTVALDFDGVLAQYHGFRGPRHSLPPNQGAIDFVNRCIAAGYEVVVHTTRPDVVTQWLRRWGFPPLQVSSEKPLALIYIDDRGFRFEGDWDAAFEAISRPPWWRRRSQVEGRESA